MKNFEKFSEKQMLSSEAREVKGGSSLFWLVCTTVAFPSGLCAQEHFATYAVNACAFSTEDPDDCLNAQCAAAIAACTIF